MTVFEYEVCWTTRLLKLSENFGLERCVVSIDFDVQTQKDYKMVQFW